MSQSKSPSNAYTITFVIVLCFSCALVLSILASALRAPQEEAQRIERSTQMLMAARIYHSDGYFMIHDEGGNFFPAKHVGKGVLVKGSKDDLASGDDILAVFERRVSAFLVNQQGQRQSFKDAGIEESQYIAQHDKEGYAKLPRKLVYEVLGNPATAETSTSTIDSYIIPIKGFGLWDVIRGFLALETDGVTVRGVAWYEHKETPGLGAEIAAPEWQAQFPGKKVFILDPSVDNPDLTSAPVGINVVRGKVEEVVSAGPKQTVSVDGMAGATLTGVGVSKAYKDVLEQYRPFLINLNEATRTPAASEAAPQAAS